MSLRTRKISIQLSILNIPKETVDDFWLKEEERTLQIYSYQRIQR